MSVRRVLTILSLVSMLACWPVVAHAAASQPDRRATTGRASTGHSPAAAAAAVAVQADFDDDGFTDLAVGVPREGVGGAALAGAVDVLPGSPTGLTGAGSQQLVQGSGGVPDAAEAFDLFGSALAVGDFDNDGFGDLAVGVPGEDVGTIDDAGAVTVLSGSATGLGAGGGQLFSQNSPGILGAAESGDGFGSALGVGDFDNDGFDDLAIGVPSEGAGAISQAGAVNVLFGSASGLSSVGNQQFLQGVGGVLGTAEIGDEFGFALGSGDFNNDGFADLAIGAPFEDVGAVLDAGAVNVLYGSAAKLTATGNQQFFQGSGGVAGVAEDGDTFGFALAVGDFNTNGFDDLAIGVLGEDVGSIQDAGAVNVLYGSATRLTSAGNQQFFQGTGGLVGTAEEGDFVGAALATGDYDNNGFDDLAVGAPFEDIGSILDAGAVDTLNGSAGTLTTTGAQLFFQGNGGVPGTPEDGDSFGSSLA
jgi:hypothetical protein